MVEGVAAILLAYLWGSVPSGYLVARLRGVDIRRYGTGNVGASNLMAHVGRRIGLGLGLFDGLAKGALPVVVAKLLGLSLEVQVGIALAAVAGHNWSLFMKLSGGRGVATAMGAYLGFGLWPQLLVGTLMVGVVGWLLLRNLALWMLLGMALMAPLAVALGQPAENAYLLLGLVALVVLKRLTANWEGPPRGAPWRRVLLWRLLYDRDVARRGGWVSRRPEESPEAPGR
jgi:glycerol-3-phosphate acyltransferase PlsY